MTAMITCPNPDCRHEQAAARTDVFACSSCGRPIRVEAISNSRSVDETWESDGGETHSQLKERPGKAADDAAASRFGRFELFEPLGSGQFGTVYRAYDPLLERPVAIKLPHPNLLDDATATNRFLREAKVAAQLRHPHIVPVYDAGECTGKHFLAAAYIDGKTLQQHIEQGGIGFQRAAKWVRSLADALHYAHRSGVTHRDVKPANIMVDARDDALLMDFGLARIGEAQSGLTQEGSLLGTPAYMSPEQASGNTQQIGPHSDQYSLGAVLYELLTGHRPFAGSSVDVLHQVICYAPAPPRRIRADVPRDLETICQKAMAKDAAERFADCGKLAADLERWLEDRPIRCRRQSWLDRSRRWVRRKPVLALGTGLVVMLTLVTTGVSLVLWQTERQSAELLAKAKAARDFAQEQKRIAEKTRADSQVELAKANQRAQLAQLHEVQARQMEETAQQALQRHQTQLKTNEALTAETGKNLAALESRTEQAKQLEEKQKTSAAELQHLYQEKPELLLVAADTALANGKRAEAMKLLEQFPEKESSWEWDALNRVAAGELLRQPAFRHSYELVWYDSMRPFPKDLLRKQTQKGSSPETWDKIIEFLRSRNSAFVMGVFTSTTTPDAFVVSNLLNRPLTIHQNAAAGHPTEIFHVTPNGSTRLGTVSTPFILALDSPMKDAIAILTHDGVEMIRSGTSTKLVEGDYGPIGVQRFLVSPTLDLAVYRSHNSLGGIDLRSGYRWTVSASGVWSKKYPSGYRATYDLQRVMKAESTTVQIIDTKTGKRIPLLPHLFTLINHEFKAIGLSLD